MQDDTSQEPVRANMAVLQIPCPKCGAILKLRDRSLLGRTGKCPKCGNRFTLSDPDEVELELVEKSAAETPLPVAAVRHVSEESPTSLAGPQPTSEPAFPLIAEPADVPSGVERLRQLGRKQSRQRRIEAVLGGIVAIAIAAAVWGGFQSLRKSPEPSVAVRHEPPKQNAVFLSERERLERTAELIADDSPTKGKPITLDYVPAGASIILNLCPAELWIPGSTGEEVRFCLGEEFTAWSEAQIAKYCLLPPAEIEEVTLFVILGGRGSEPQVAAVVRPKEPLKPSELIRRFNGTPRDVEGVQVYVGDERAFVIGKELDDQKRPQLFATAPAALAEDLARSVEVPGLTSDAIRALLEHTDRQRHLSLIFQPADLGIQEEALFPSELRPLVSHLVEQLGADAEAAAWSIHFTPDDFHSELLIRTDPKTTATRLLAATTQRLDSLPEELVTAVSKMNPTEFGDRKLVGRLPAMTQLFAAATIGGIDDRLIVLQTRLPERAGPNLALAGLLAWHESTRTDFSKPAAPAPAPASGNTLADRLKKPLEIDFRRTPLEETFALIGGEIGVKFEIDGDSLKLAGYTRNMPQSLALGTVPAEKAVAAILAQYDKMAVVLDESSGNAIVTTKAAAEEKGLTPANLSP